MPVSLADLKEAYKNASKKGVETFELDNCVYITQYAKYLIEYLSSLYEDNTVLNFVQKEG